MPYYFFREIWTPLAIFEVRFYKEIYSKKLFIKIGNRNKRVVF